MSRAEKSKTIARVCKTLELKYSLKGGDTARSPLDELVLALLAENTSEKKANDALKRLKTRFVDWNEVRVSTPGEIRDAIGASTAENGKAEAIKSILAQIFAKHNKVSLDFLTELKAKEVREYLYSLDGVPSFAVASVLLSLNVPAIPVDEDIARVSSRIGLVKETWAKERMQKSLESIVPKSRMYPFFKLCREHARKVCLARSFKCRICPIAKDCVTRKAELASRKRTKKAVAPDETSRKAMGRSASAKEGRAKSSSGNSKTAGARAAASTKTRSRTQAARSRKTAPPRARASGSRGRNRAGAKSR